MSDSFEIDEMIDPVDIEFFKFSGLVPDVKVSIQEESFDISKYPASVSLLACSNKSGQFVAATTKGFIFGSTKTLRTIILSAKKGETQPLSGEAASVALTKAIRQVRFSADEKHILVALEGGSVSVYNTDDIQNQKGNVKPINSFELGHEITDLRPNPNAHGNMAAVLYTNQQCALIDFTTGTTERIFSIDNITAICWSFKGKQIVCGKNDGGLELFDVNGAVKDSLSIPEAMSAGHGTETENRYVCDVLWIDNHIFLAMFARKRNTDDDDYINDGYIINRKPATGSGPVYTHLAEITPIFTTEGRGNRFYMEIIRGLGKEIKHLVIIANAATNELSVVGHNENDEWATWQLPENGLANLHLSEKTLTDTYPVGLALDITADEKLPPFDSSEKDVPVEPMPVFYYLNDEGDIAAYHCYNIELARRGGSFKDENATTTTTAAAPTANTVVSPPPSGLSAFGAATAAATGGSSFTDILSGKSISSAVPLPGSTSGFGSFGSFGSTAAVPSFSSLGSAPNISGGFGSTAIIPTATLSFGASTGFGSATNSNSSSLFGSTTSFGATPSANQSSTATHRSKEIASEKPITTSIPSEPSVPSLNLGSLSTNSDKKPETSNAEIKPTAFGFTSALGSGSFGSPATNTVPGAKFPVAATIPTISATSPSANASLPGSTSLFGSVSTMKAPTTTITPTTTAANTFGATSSLKAGGFGLLSKNTVPGAKSPATTTAFGSFSSFGTPAPVKTTTATTPTPNTAATASVATTTTSASTSEEQISATKPIKPVVSLAPTVSPVSTKDKAAESTGEKLKPTAEDGMAKEYEELYIIVTDEIDQVKVYCILH
ncbi:hypothetical protein BD408DRAFT_36826 [Parasitella parasitica]|nr:hypothetical protein BD408DRAFT_36826 [Parasitella parasitica]